MASLLPDKLAKASIPVSTGWLLGACMEARGKQELWTRRKPEALRALREQAIIQSAESSNRIEGVTIAPDRLRPVVVGHAKPRNRPEAELAGYRKALDWIFSRRRPVRMAPAVMLHLHALAQGGAVGDAGRFKGGDNEIVEILANGERRVRFRPTAAKETPAAAAALCVRYREANECPEVPALLATAAFILDFLCIHPFRDGNGRVSRLLTTLLLLQDGYEVGRYISMERLVEESREEYYEVLARCSRNWHEDKNEIVPWWNYFLGVLHGAYRELESKAGAAAAVPAKSDLVRQTILAQVGPFMLAELAAQCPSASRQLIKKVLGQMKKAGDVRLTGRGRGARWEVARRSASK